MKGHRAVLTVILALALSAAITRAQAPDFEERPARPQQARQPRAIWGGINGLLAIEGTEATVANVGDGVEVTITTEKPEAVQGLQERVTQTVEQNQKRMEQMRQHVAGGQWAARVPGLWGLLIRDEIDLGVAPIEKGVVLSLTGKTPEVVKNLQENMPQWVEEARDRQTRNQEMRKRWQVINGVNRLIADGAVKVDVVPTDDGVNVKFTAEDPEVATKIKELMPQYFKAMADQRGQPGQPIVRQWRQQGGAGGEVRHIEMHFPRPKAPPQGD